MLVSRHYIKGICEPLKQSKRSISFPLLGKELDFEHSLWTVLGDTGHRVDILFVFRVTACCCGWNCSSPSFWREATPGDSLWLICNFQGGNPCYISFRCRGITQKSWFLQPACWAHSIHWRQACWLTLLKADGPINTQNSSCCWEHRYGLLNPCKLLTKMAAIVLLRCL